MCHLTQSLDGVFKGKKTSHLNKITIFNLCKAMLFVCDFSSVRSNLENKQGYTVGTKQNLHANFPPPQF